MSEQYKRAVAAASQAVEAAYKQGAAQPAAKVDPALHYFGAGYTMGPEMQEYNDAIPSVPDQWEGLVEPPPPYEPPPMPKDEKFRAFTLLLEYFPNALIEVLRASEYGAKKYAPGQWRELPVSAFENAAARHMLTVAAGELFDPEPCAQGLMDAPLHHWAQVAWNALAACQKLMTGSDR